MDPHCSRLARRPGRSAARPTLRPPDHWRSTQVTLIQDKLTDAAIDRVKGARQSRAPRILVCTNCETALTPDQLGDFQADAGGVRRIGMLLEKGTELE
jgi:hypothetical protein